MVKLDLVYVLINIVTGKVEMATGNDSEAWAMYRDMKDMRISIFLDKNLVASVEPKRTSI